MSKDDKVSRTNLAVGVIGAIGVIVTILIQIGGVGSGYGSQSTQIAMMRDQIHFLEAKMDMAISDVTNLKQQIGVLDSKATTNAAMLADSVKNNEAKFTSESSNITYIDQEINSLNSKIKQNALDLAEIYKKITTVNPVTSKCLDLIEEFQSGYRSIPGFTGAIDKKDVLEAMKELNCNSISHSP